MRSSPFAPVALLALAFAQPAFAAAPTTQACIDADTQAQTLRVDEKLVAARKQLEVCIDPACPAMVRDDCAQRMDELVRIQPSLILSAKDGAGKDLVLVRVTLDGAPIADSLDGRPIAVDPGRRVLVFEAGGAPKVEETVVVREGEKARAVAVTIAHGPGAPGAPVAPSSPPPTDDENRGSGQRILGVAMAGVGVVGVGLGVVFGLTASSSWSAAQDLCSPTHCPGATRNEADDDRASAQTKGTLSTIGFIGGGVLLAAGAVIYFTAPKASAVQVGFAPSLGGGALQGRF